MTDSDIELNIQKIKAKYMSWDQFMSAVTWNAWITTVAVVLTTGGAVGETVVCLLRVGRLVGTPLGRERGCLDGCLEGR